MSEKWNNELELVKTQIIQVQDRIEAVNELDEIFEEVDDELYDENFDRL